MLERPSNIDSVALLIGEFRLDSNLRGLFRGGERLRVSPKPLSTLEFLVANRHRVVSKAELLEKVWGGQQEISTVEQAISQLRRALGDDPANPRYIETVPGQGYRLIVAVRPVDGAPDSHIVGEETLLVPVPLNATHGPRESTASAAPIRPRWIRYLAAAALTILAVGLFLYATAPGEPAACEVSINTLIVKDGQGREVWRREFPRPLYKERYAAHPPLCRFLDLDGDGVSDVLFSLRPEAFQVESDELYGFITRSRMLRRLGPNPSKTLMFQPGADFVVGLSSDGTIAKPDNGYLGPYTIAGVFTTKDGGSGARIVVSSVTNYAPNQIAVLDGDFKKISEYWHTGHLKYGQFATFDGHDRLFLGGVNNGYRSATLVAFDPRNIHGTTDLSMKLADWRPDFAVYGGWSHAHLTPFGAGTETCKVLFERTCVAKATPHREPYNRVTGLTVNKANRISVTVAEGEREDTPETITYEMDRHLNLVSAFPNTKFKQRHLELEQAGLLDHSFSMEELKPLVHVLPGCEFVENRK